MVGEKGAGKGTFAKFLQRIEPDSSYIRYSDILADTLKKWSLPLTRVNYQTLANTMEKTFGNGTMANATKSRIKKLPGRIVIVDGIRRWLEAKLIRSFPNSLIIYITADIKTRYRNLKKKSDKANEMGLSFKQFIKEEQDEAEILIPEIGKIADHKIINNGSLDTFRRQVKKLYKKFRLQLGQS